MLKRILSRDMRGNFYKLVVDWNSEQFEAEDQLLSVVDIDSLVPDLADDDREVVGQSGKGGEGENGDGPVASPGPRSGI